MVELVGGGSDINGATPSSFSVSLLLLASVERFGVSRMRDFFLLNFCCYHYKIFSSVQCSAERGGGEWGWGCGQPTAHGTALPTAISPNWCTCTLNVQKFGFANLAHDDFFLLNFCCYHYKIFSSVQCSAA